MSGKIWWPTASFRSGTGAVCVPVAPSYRTKYAVSWPPTPADSMPNVVPVLRSVPGFTAPYTR